MIRSSFNVIILLIFTLLLSCTPSPEPIHFGYDQCENCRMLISDHKYGAEIVSNKSKVYKFDSIECMTVFYLTEKLKKEDIYSIWVINFDDPANFIDAGKASYLKSENLQSPMGLNLSAHALWTKAEKLQMSYSGMILSWPEIQIVVRKAWL